MSTNYTGIQVGACSKLQKSGGATAMNAPIIIIKRRRRIK